MFKKTVTLVAGTAAIGVYGLVLAATVAAYRLGQSEASDSFGDDREEWEADEEEDDRDDFTMNLTRSLMIGESDRVNAVNAQILFDYDVAAEAHQDGAISIDTLDSYIPRLERIRSCEEVIAEWKDTWLGGAE